MCSAAAAAAVAAADIRATRTMPAAEAATTAAAAAAQAPATPAATSLGGTGGGAYARLEWLCRPEKMGANMAITPGPWLFTNTARTKLANNTFRFTLDTWKCGLVLSTSNIGAGSTTWAGVDHEHANANGYITGGVGVAFSLSGSTSVAINWESPPYWVAAGGSIVARRAAIYESGGDVLAYSLLDEKRRRRHHPRR